MQLELVVLVQTLQDVELLVAVKVAALLTRNGDFGDGGLLRSCFSFFENELRRSSYHEDLGVRGMLGEKRVKNASCCSRIDEIKQGAGRRKRLAGRNPDPAGEEAPASVEGLELGHFLLEVILSVGRMDKKCRQEWSV